MNHPITTIDGIQYRACRDCGTVKPLSEYPIVKSKRNGKPRQVRRAVCTRCRQDHLNAIRRQKSISRENITPATKVCPRCGVEKPSAEFHRQRREPDGLATYCKQCASAYYRANKEQVTGRVIKWQRENMDRHMEKQRRWNEKNIDKVRAKNRILENRRRTRKTEAGGNFTQEEWTALCERYDNRCLACGAEGPLTVDHVIPVSKGGSSDISNLQPLCMACNTRKRARVIDYRVGRP